MNRKLFAVWLGAYLVALIATLPAPFLDAALRHASNDRLRLVESSGTLWSGAGQIEFRDADGRSGVAKDVAWRCRPWSLIGGRLVLDVELDHSPKRFSMTISFPGVDIADADVNLPAAVLGLALPKLVPFGLGGDLSLHVANISLRRDGVRGGATLQWRSASSALTPVAPFGDYELRLDSDAGTPDVSLRTLRGALVMEGKASSMAGGERLFLATLRVPAAFRQQLAPLLRLMTVERGEGIFELQIR